MQKRSKSSIRHQHRQEVANALRPLQGEQLLHVTAWNSQTHAASPCQLHSTLGAASWDLFVAQLFSVCGAGLTDGTLLAADGVTTMRKFSDFVAQYVLYREKHRDLLRMLRQDEALQPRHAGPYAPIERATAPVDRAFYLDVICVTKGAALFVPPLLRKQLQKEQRLLEKYCAVPDRQPNISSSSPLPQEQAGEESGIPQRTTSSPRTRPNTTEPAKSRNSSSGGGPRGAYRACSPAVTLARRSGDILVKKRAVSPSNVDDLNDPGVDPFEFSTNHLAMTGSPMESAQFVRAERDMQLMRRDIATEARSVRRSFFKAVRGEAEGEGEGGGAERTDTMTLEETRALKSSLFDVADSLRHNSKPMLNPQATTTGEEQQQGAPSSALRRVSFANRMKRLLSLSSASNLMMTAATDSNTTAAAEQGKNKKKNSHHDSPMEDEDTPRALEEEENSHGTALLEKEDAIAQHARSKHHSAARSPRVKLRIAFPLGVVRNRLGELVKIDGGDVEPGTLVTSVTTGELFKVEWCDGQVAHCRWVLRAMDPCLQHCVTIANGPLEQGLVESDLYQKYRTHWQNVLEVAVQWAERREEGVEEVGSGNQMVPHQQQGQQHVDRNKNGPRKVQLSAPHAAPVRQQHQYDTSMIAYGSLPLDLPESAFSLRTHDASPSLQRQLRSAGLSFQPLYDDDDSDEDDDDPDNLLQRRLLAEKGLSERDIAIFKDLRVLFKAGQKKLAQTKSIQQKKKKPSLFRPNQRGFLLTPTGDDSEAGDNILGPDALFARKVVSNLPRVVVSPHVSFLTDICVTIPVHRLRPTTTFRFLMWLHIALSESIRHLIALVTSSSTTTTITNQTNDDHEREKELLHSTPPPSSLLGPSYRHSSPPPPVLQGRGKEEDCRSPWDVAGHLLLEDALEERSQLKAQFRFGMKAAPQSLPNRMLEGEQQHGLLRNPLVQSCAAHESILPLPELLLLSQSDHLGPPSPKSSVVGCAACRATPAAAAGSSQVVSRTASPTSEKLRHATIVL